MNDREKTFRPLRAWPAVLLALLMLAGRFGPQVSDDAMAKYWMASVFGPLLCCLLLLIWWLTTSRATWRERLFGFLGIIVGAVVATYLGQALGWYRADEGAGFIGAIVGAIIVLFIYGLIAGRRSTSSY